MMKQKLLASLAVFCLLTGTMYGQQSNVQNTTSTNEKEILIGYCHEDETMRALGSGAADSIGCAIYYNSTQMAPLKGDTIKAIRFALSGSLKYVSDVKVWITTAVGLNNQVNQGVASVKAGWNEITLDKPYIIKGTALYIGYSFVLSKVDDKNDDGRPLAVNSTSTPTGLILYFKNGSNKKWGNYYSQSLGSLMLQCLVGSSKTFHENEVTLDEISYCRALTNNSFLVTGVVTNRGKKALNSLGINYNVGNTPNSKDIALTAPYYGMQSTFNFTATSPSASGRYPISVTVNKINNTEVTNASSASSTLINMDESYPRKTVMEAATGVWCGYCPRVAAALERLQKEYGDKFIGIAMHASTNSTTDPMQVDAYKPIISKLAGIPGCLLDRAIQTDPYYGNQSDNTYGIGKVFSTAQTRLSEAQLTVSNKYTDASQKKIAVTSVVNFSYNADSTRYKMAYVLLEDSVTGSKANNYYQTNYYNADFYKKYVGDPAKMDAGLADYKDKPTQITGVPFNNVAIGIYDCLGIEGSLEGKIIKGEPKTHTYEINLPTSIQHKANVKLVAMLIDNTTGEIVNAEMVKLNNATGLVNLQTETFDAEIKATSNELIFKTNTQEETIAQVYDLSGKLVADTAFRNNIAIPSHNLKGCYIIRISNGNDVVVKKIIIP